MVFEARPFAASAISEPEPDVLVAPISAGWDEHPARAHLIVEISRTSLRTDKGPKAQLYGLAEVDEYWIVNQVDALVEVYRDRHAGEWRSKQVYRRGETIAMAIFPDGTIAVAELLPPASE